MDAPAIVPGVKNKAAKMVLLIATGVVAGALAVKLINMGFSAAKVPFSI